MIFPQPPLQEQPIAGSLPWVHWFSTIQKYLKVETRITPTLGAGWSDFGSGYQGATYWKDNATGMVHIEGLIKNTGSPVAGDVIFTLPEGYRPASTLLFTVGTANSPASHTIGRFDISTSGQVIFQDGSHNYYFQLNGISFRAA